jgi:hypothetical protein
MGQHSIWISPPVGKPSLRMMNRTVRILDSTGKLERTIEAGEFR